jgi:DNA-binding MarR family transcriptional regulator
MPTISNAASKPSDSTQKPPETADPKPKWGAFTEKFGLTVRDAGVTAVPRVLLTGLAALKLKPMECVVLLQLISCWGDAKTCPHPKRKTLRDWLGCDKRTLDRAIAGLVEKNLLTKTTRAIRGRRRSNEYDLSGLVEQLKPLGRRALEEKKKYEALRAAAAL